MYSAAIRNSSMVADMPRFSSTGLAERPDLEHVSVVLHQVAIFGVNGFGNDQQSEFAANLRQNLQAIFAHALKAVRRGAGFESAATEQLRPGALHSTRRRKGLLAAFDGARPGNDGQFPAPKSKTCPRTLGGF